MRQVVFVGPSLPVGLRAELADTLVLPPVCRGDLRRPEVVAAQRIGIIDGEFDQSRTVTPREIMARLDAGAEVFGSSSMGALRAAELHTVGMVGIGEIYRMFRDEEVYAEDEVAVCFEPDGDRALCEPLVNIRCALRRAQAAGQIEPEEAQAVLAVAQRLDYPARIYRGIVRLAGRELGRQLGHLESILSSYDQKRDDALELWSRLGPTGGHA